MGRVSSKVSEVELNAYRQMDCAAALPLLTEYMKADRDFTPLKNSHTHRWHVVAGDTDFDTPQQAFRILAGAGIRCAVVEWDGLDALTE